MSQAYDNAEKELILTGFDETDQATLLAVFDVIYGFYADRAGLLPRLRYYYVRRHCADHLLASTYKNFERREGDSMLKRGEIYEHLLELREDANTEVLRLEATARGNRGGAVAPLSTTGAYHRIPGAPNPGSTALRGDPQKRAPWPM